MNLTMLNPVCACTSLFGLPIAGSDNDHVLPGLLVTIMFTVSVITDGTNSSGLYPSWNAPPVTVPYWLFKGLS